MAAGSSAPAGPTSRWRYLALLVAAAIAAGVAAALWLRPAGPAADGEAKAPPTVARAVANAGVGVATAETPGASLAWPKRVAVLPFTASPANPEADPLRLGLLEILIQRLGSSGEVEVVGRQSVLGVAALELGPGQAAVLLNAAYMLDGRLVLDAQEMELEVEFTDAHTGNTLWRARFTGDLGLLQRLPDQLERRIRDTLRAAANPSHEAVAEGEPARSEIPTEANLAYLKGRFAADQRTGEGLQRSLQWYARAIDLAPDYAAPWTGIAQAQQLLVWYAGVPPAEAYPEAMQAADTALQLEPDNAEAAAVIGLVLWTYRRDLAGAERALRRALELNPVSADALHGLAQLLALTGRLEESEAAFTRALEIEPLSLVMRTDFGSSLLWNGDPSGALEIYDYVLQLDPDFALAHMFTGLALHSLGRHDEATTRLERAAQLGGRPPLWLALLARTRAAAGDQPTARALLAELDAKRQSRFVSPVAIALVRLALGERNAALAELERALTEHDPLLIYLMSYPEFAALQGDPSFDRLLARVWP